MTLEKSLLERKAKDTTLGSEFEELNREIANLREQLKEKETQIQALKHSVLVHEGDKTESENKNKALLEENGRLKALETTVAQLLSHKKELEGTISGLEKALKDQQSKENASGSQTEQITRELSELKERVKEKEAQVRSLSLTISNLEKVI